MRIEIERDAFFDGLSKTVPITEKKSTLPILSHILMEASGSEMVITATDLEVGLRMRYECEVKDPGKITVPSKKIFEIVRELPSGRIDLELLQTGRIRITSGSSHFELASMDPADYPAWSKLEEVEPVSVPARKLLRIIDKTVYAASIDDSRFNLNGIHFEQQGEETRVVATDGHRLAMINEEIGLRLKSQVLVPRKGLSDIRRVLEHSQEDVSIGFEPKNMVIETPNFTMTTRLLEGEYPDYRKVVPEKGDKIVKADRQELMQTLRRVAVLTSDHGRGISVAVSRDKMLFTATHPDLGTAEGSLGVEYDGEEFEIIINVLYLIESLGVIDTDSVFIEYGENDAPVIVRPDPPEGYFNLVMPMRR
jgi:DNA polymerase-3 subunit beta